MHIPFFRILDPCETNEGPEPNKTCILPFIWNDIKYETCAPKHGTDEYWCATKVDYNNGVMLSIDNWGVCDPKTCLSMIFDFISFKHLIITQKNSSSSIIIILILEM